ncbi:MAG: uridine diphosphate-N-acetylglucosamine-binding protein YvcK [Candidatus Omnitrophica bacterium]|nr:uridine diphosphate-N-acetylglucosamine-binding protein YvcK [Candidatus Omnitrophota bacterium]
MNFFKWLYPGMRIKRWILLFIAGITVIMMIALYGVKMIAGKSIFLALFVAAVLVLGLFVIVTSIKNILRTFVRVLMPQVETDLVSIVYQKRHERALERGPRVVVVGGGTGLNVLLQGIKEYTNNISAIVTVTDTGGSSGRLRNEFDMLPPGDIRNCLVALADRSPLLNDLFQYRFEDGTGLKGHNFGNLFITALSKITGCFDLAVKEASKVLAIRGQVIPSTLDKVTLVAEFEDGSTAEGETTIVDMHKKIKQIALKPHDCRPTKEAIEAIETADMVILGPGSLFTSVLPNILISDIQKALEESDAFKIYVANVMTQPGETDDMSAYEHYDVLVRHTSDRIVNACLVNIGTIPGHLKKMYAEKDQFPVELDLDKIKDNGVMVFKENVINVENTIKHSAELLAKALFDVYLKFGVKESNAEEK